MGVRSTGNQPSTTQSDGHLLEYFRSTFGSGGGATAAGPLPHIQATGGTINDYTDGGKVYRSHVFTETGQFDVTDVPTSYDNGKIDYLVVAGGGGGGPMYAGNFYSAAGGGGAGGLKTSIPGVMPNTGAMLPVNTSTYNVVIGGGGANTSHQKRGGTGVDSSLAYNGGTITSAGGGGGGSTNASDVDDRDGGPGGSGGGVSGNQHTGTAVGGDASPNSDTDRQGYPGAGPFGAAPENDGAGGGGGGAGGPGPQAAYPTSEGLAGGPGVQVAIAGPTAISFTGVGAKNPANNQYQYFAGGGAGGSYPNTSPPAPLGGGGAGGNSDMPATQGGHNGLNNTGGGGGGAGGNGDKVGGAGGSGIVIVRYQIGTTSVQSKATGGLVYNSGTKAIHVFNTSGTFTITSPLTNVEILSVAGGGGGGTLNGGGGGAGGLLYSASASVSPSPGVYQIVVGAGGRGTEPYTPVSGPIFDWWKWNTYNNWRYSWHFMGWRWRWFKPT